MAVEIKELVIRAEVRERPGGGSAAGGGGGGGGIGPAQREALIQECVDQVMRILNDRAER